MIEASSDRAGEESRPLRDYLRFLLWVWPALLASAFSHVLLVPRMGKLLEAAAVEIEEMGPLRGLVSSYDFFFGNFYIILLCGTVLVIVAELTTKWWPRRRRVLLGLFAWLFNFVVLVALLLLGTIALALATVVPA